MRSIETDAKLITNGIKASEEGEDYPNLQNYSAKTAMSFLLESLKSYLKIVIVDTNKENNEKKQPSFSLSHQTQSACSTTSDWISHTSASSFRLKVPLGFTSATQFL